MPHSDGPESAAKYKRHDRFDWINLVVGILTLVVVGVYTGIQLCQTILIRGNNVVSERAFVSVGPFSIINGINRDTKAPLAQFIFPMINGGNTPTKNFHFFIRCAPSVDSLPEPWVLFDRGKVDYHPQVIGPKAF